MKKTIHALLLFLLLSLTHATGQQVRFALAMHSEAPGGGSNGIPITPDFLVASKSIYLRWREALIHFAKDCSVRGIAWQFQPDYNFLLGVMKYEVSGGAAYDSRIVNGTFFDVSLSTYTYDAAPRCSNTNGLNVVKYLHEVLGVNLDPHSHESNSDYNYADVAWLIDVGCDTDATLVVGGHLYTGATWQDWPKFIEDRDGNGLLDGLKSATHGEYRWKPVLLMGGGTASHANDPHISGLWKPQDGDHYFTHSTSGAIAAVGNWEQDLHETDRLLRLLESGTLPHQNKLWTVGRVVNHRDLLQTGYLDTVVPALLDTLDAWRDEGRFQIVTFVAIYNEWLAAPYSQQSSLYQRPEDNITFSMNWQDFHHTVRSCEDMRTLLNQHESQQVPVDVFLTTWQTDILESQAPELLGRLFSSRWVNLAYHVRAPKPYASAAIWNPSFTSADVSTYESSQLDMVHGTPVVGVSGGYAKLSQLYGTGPNLVGPNSSGSARATVYPYFIAAGTRMVVQHDSTSAVNFGTEWISGLNRVYVRPESYDWRMIEVYEPERAASPPATGIADAFSKARSAAGATSPYFVGVKIHDNDSISTDSAWNQIYVTARKLPDWDPYNPSLYAALHAQTEADRRRAYYLDVVADAAAQEASLNLMDARDTLSLLGEEEPRFISLSHTELLEGQPIGTELAEISGGGVESGVRCSYSLVSGAGSDDNAAFSIIGSRLLAATVLSSSDPVRHIRIQWMDGGGNSGARELTVTVSPADSDGDGFTEQQEVAAGTNPRNSSSRLAIHSCSSVGSSYTASWSSVVGRSYHIEASSNLSQWLVVPGSQVTATATTTSSTVNFSPGQRMFFRVVLD